MWVFEGLGYESCALGGTSFVGGVDCRTGDDGGTRRGRMERR